ncbi:aspartyl protease family protein [Sphingomonas sp. MMS24-J13]|uniref:aspartyl protease family protein n=1 Tax=Sphingomonas sp. MMS24-J13 TaxID=3238686 RepID=UPI00384DAD2D
MLGLNVLSVADTEYDLAGGSIRLFRTPGCSGSDLAYWARDRHVSSIALAATDRRSPHIVGMVTVNGQPMRAVFDTGAPRSMMTLQAAAKAGMTPQNPRARSDGTSRGLGPTVNRSWSAPFDTFSIGDEQIQNARLRFSEMPGFNFDLLLGADFFLSHRLFVSHSTERILLTYNGGAVFDPAGKVRFPGSKQADPDLPAAGEAMPTDADGFARRGAASAARRDFTNALSDLSRAIALAPTNAAYLYARASTYRAMRQTSLAKADLDAAIALKPDYVEALIDRAVIYLTSSDRTTGMADLRAAARAAPDGGNVHMALAELYVRADAYEQAISQYGQWLVKHGPQDSRYSQALNGRCWARAMLGRELDQALIDCNTAVRAAPDAAGYRDTRGLLRLRMGDLDRAIADYDAALAMQPNIAWSLYGRGIARHRKHLQAQGDADIAAALAIDPSIPAQAQRYGVTLLAPTPK